MVVANDVTRDSRVLREASVLAAVGHRVTILGIMTARTTAPEVEVRDGFVIRRLRYRARPPGWWIPPDFYARIRYRSNRQYRIHRARLMAFLRRTRRQIRLFRRRARPRAYRSSVARWALGLTGTARQPTRLSRLGDRGRYAVEDLVSLLRRARRAPRRAWARKARAGISHGHRWVASGRWLSRARKSGPGPSLRGLRRNARSRGDAPRVTLRGLSAIIRSSIRGAERMAVAPLRVIQAIGRGVRAWASILALLTWGSAYLLANRFTSGAIEWQTGWRWRWMGWARYVADQAPDADVWHGHDMTSLPAIVELKRTRGGMAIYDSHEIYLESGRHADQPRWAKAPLEALERRLVAEVDAVVTVNHSVAGILERRLGRSDIHVLYNCPLRRSSRRGPSPIRRALGLARSVPLLLYHGSLAPHRGIEQLLEAIQRPELGQVQLAFLGFGSMTEWLRSEVTHPRYGGRVHLFDAVAPDDLADWLRGVDVAVAPIQPSTVNHRNSSPNKVFEAIAAGTPVAGSDFAEFRRVISDPVLGPLGTLFDPSEPADIARAVRQILDATPAARAALRRRCRDASARRWNWETESLGLVSLYDEFAAEKAARPDAVRGVRVA